MGWACVRTNYDHDSTVTEIKNPYCQHVVLHVCVKCQRNLPMYFWAMNWLSSESANFCSMVLNLSEHCIPIKYNYHNIVSCGHTGIFLTSIYQITVIIYCCVVKEILWSRIWYWKYISTSASRFAARFQNPDVSVTIDQLLCIVPFCFVEQILTLIHHNRTHWFHFSIVAVMN